MIKLKKKKSKKILFIIILFVIIVILGVFYIIKTNQKQDLLKKQELLKTEITNHYSEKVITNKESKIYDSNEKEIGVIGKNVFLQLENTDITEKTKYFKIKGFEDTYIKYNDVEKNNDIKEPDTRYKKYIPFNTNIKTNDITSFYDKDNNLVYTFHKSYDLPIIIKDMDKYGVEFQNSLLYIKKDDVKEIYDNNNNTSKSNSSGVAVLNYHFFYDDSDPEAAKKCNEIICESKTKFKKELELIKEMNMFTVTMNELELYMDGKLRLPKSVLITIDDGASTKVGIDTLTEYKMNATVFLITSWYNPKEYYKTEYIELHSHSHNLHNGGKCPGGQGGEIKCLDKNTLLNDLKQSRELLNNTTAFCYPFYEYNTYSENILKEAGFTMAFIGEIETYYGYKLAEVNGDKMKIPRFVMFNYTTLNDLKNYFNEIK